MFTLAASNCVHQPQPIPMLACVIMAAPEESRTSVQVGQKAAHAAFQLARRGSNG